MEYCLFQVSVSLDKLLLNHKAWIAGISGMAKDKRVKTMLPTETQMWILRAKSQAMWKHFFFLLQLPALNYEAMGIVRD
jgi:hypothetical protein